MNKKTKAMLLMIVCAVLWSTAGIFIKLINWNPIGLPRKVQKRDFHSGNPSALPGHSAELPKLSGFFCCSP